MKFEKLSVEKIATEELGVAQPIKKDVGEIEGGGNQEKFPSVNVEKLKSQYTKIQNQLVGLKEVWRKLDPNGSLLDLARGKLVARQANKLASEYLALKRKLKSSDIKIAEHISDEELVKRANDNRRETLNNSAKRSTEEAQGKLEAYKKVYEFHEKQKAEFGTVEGWSESDRKGNLSAQGRMFEWIQEIETKRLAKLASPITLDYIMRFPYRQMDLLTREEYQEREIRMLFIGIANTLGAHEAIGDILQENDGSSPMNSAKDTDKKSDHPEERKLA